MRIRVRASSVFVFVVVLTIQAALTAHAQQAASVARPAELCVMSYNLRYASANPPNSWPERRPIMKECIERVRPDFLGTQEGVYEQLKDLAQDLERYEWIGLGREGGSRGEFMAIYYLRERFEPLAYDHFWLSDTPDLIGSSTWGNTVRRMVTWVRFLDRTSGREFYLANTHFDHQIQESREKSALLLHARMAALKPERPIIITGDFNAVAGKNPAYDTLTGDGLFRDTWTAADEREGEGMNSFNGFRPGPHTGGNRIDWILVSKPFTVRKTVVDTFSRGNQYPSDHFPVISWLVLE